MGEVMSWDLIINSEDCPHKHIDFLDYEWCEVQSIEEKVECCENDCPYKEGN